MFRVLMTSRRFAPLFWPANILAFSLRGLRRILLRLEVVGRENFAPAGEANIIAVDHVSWVDAPIPFSLMRRRRRRRPACGGQKLARAALPSMPECVRP
jgi:1-acyl-sn-glycerol-3-phosphate acyltransferase